MRKGAARQIKQNTMHRYFIAPIARKKNNKLLNITNTQTSSASIDVVGHAVYPVFICRYSFSLAAFAFGRRVCGDVYASQSHHPIPLRSP